MRSKDPDLVRPRTSRWQPERKFAPRSRAFAVRRRSPARWKWSRRARCAGPRSAWLLEALRPSNPGGGGPHRQCRARVQAHVHGRARSAAGWLYRRLHGPRAVWRHEHQSVQEHHAFDEEWADQGPDRTVLIGAKASAFLAVTAAMLPPRCATSARSRRCRPDRRRKTMLDAYAAGISTACSWLATCSSTP